MKTEFTLGQKIIINSYYKRVIEYRKHHEYERRFKIWKEIKLEKDEIVIVVGIRSLMNGWISYEDDYGNVFTGTEKVKALLVTGRLSEKPYYIPMPKLI